MKIDRHKEKFIPFRLAETCFCGRSKIYFPLLTSTNDKEDNIIQLKIMHFLVDYTYTRRLMII